MQDPSPCMHLPASCFATCGSPLPSIIYSPMLLVFDQIKEILFEHDSFDQTNDTPCSFLLHCMTFFWGVQPEIWRCYSQLLQENLLNNERLSGLGVQPAPCLPILDKPKCSIRLHLHRVESDPKDYIVLGSNSRHTTNNRNKAHQSSV